MKITNPLGVKFRGTLGKSVTAATWNGTNYLRAYSKRSRAPTHRQAFHRELFKAATEVWKGLSPEEQAPYKDEAKGRMTGFNLFVRKFFEAIDAGTVPDHVRNLEEILRRADAAASWAVLDKDEKRAYNDEARGQGMSGRDLFMRRHSDARRAPE